MSCISSELIQKYVDGEITSEEKSIIEKHIRECENCSLLIRERILISGMIKDVLTYSVKDDMEIPEFVSPTRSRKKVNSKRVLIYSISAACLLYFIFLLPFHRENEKPDEITIINSLVPEIDANRTVSQQEIVIEVIDKNGNITEYIE